MTVFHAAIKMNHTTKKQTMILINPINAAVFGAEEHGSMRQDLANIDKHVASTTTTATRRGVVELNVNCVICARGKRAFNHEGNVRFRQLVEAKMEEYANAKSKLDKSLIVSQIIDGVRQAQPEGAFLREENGHYYEVGDGAAREKVGQQFRDLLHEKYKSATKSKKRRRVESAARNASSSIPLVYNGGRESRVGLSAPMFCRERNTRKQNSEEADLELIPEPVPLDQMFSPRESRQLRRSFIEEIQRIILADIDD